MYRRIIIFTTSDMVPVWYFIILIIHYVHSEVPIVNTTQGFVRGLEGENGEFYMYLGISYGLVDSKNPFGPPLPHPVFEDIFNATDDSTICPQMEDNDVLGSLDCLHLNVFVPNIPNNENIENLPVLVFLYGGAFEVGFSAQFLYGPEYLVRHNIILITLNYRLGPYGFMCTDSPRVPGNQALKDQLLALNWIHNNINNFGGDPNKITLSGNSAGAMSADLHVISQTPKFFQQIILQSGSSHLPSFPTIDKETPLKLSSHFGFDTTNIDEALDFLANKAPFDVMLAWRELGLVFRPCIENEFEGVEAFITENWVEKEVISNAKDLNIMIGFSDNEALGLFLLPSSGLTDIVNQSLSNFDIDHPDFFGLSEVGQFFFGDEEKDFKNAIDLRSDLTFVHNSIRTVNRYLKSEAGNIFLYQFSYDGGRNFAKRNINTTLPGAAHADEIGYLFDVSYLDSPTVQDKLIIDRMTEMWTNFVKFGDPTPQITQLLPLRWNPITVTSPLHYINIDSDLTDGTNIYNDRVAFWDVFYELNGHLHRFILDNQ